QALVAYFGGFGPYQTYKYGGGGPSSTSLLYNLNREGTPASGMNNSTRSLLLLLLFLIALFLRVYHLGSYGLSEDEANKMLAVESYRGGDFTANAEHPMFMKLLCTASVILSEKWNSLFPSASISTEAALRFPLAVAGALITLVIYFLGAEILNSKAALIAA